VESVTRSASSVRISRASPMRARPDPLQASSSVTLTLTNWTSGFANRRRRCARPLTVRNWTTAWPTVSRWVGLELGLLSLWL
jgi:transposase